MFATLLCSGVAFGAESAILAVNEVSVEQQQKNKVLPGRLKKIEQNVKKNVEKVAATIQLTQEDKDFLFGVWKQCEVETFENTPQGSGAEGRRVAWRTAKRKCDSQINKRFGKEKTAEINKALKAK